MSEQGYRDQVYKRADGVKTKDDLDQLINDLLYPQYAYKFGKFISTETWASIQEQAKKLLADDLGADIVKAHWESIVSGVVPFGFVVKDDR